MAKRDIIEMGVMSFALNLFMSIVLVAVQFDVNPLSSSEVSDYSKNRIMLISADYNYTKEGFDSGLCTDSNCTEKFLTGSASPGTFDKISDAFEMMSSVGKVLGIAALSTLVPLVWGLIITPYISVAILQGLFWLFLAFWQIATVVALYSFFSNKRGVNDE